MDIILYGAGSFGKNFLKACPFYDLNVIAFVDNDIDKQGKSIDGIKIYSPEDAQELLQKHLVFVSSSFDDAEQYIKEITNDKYISYIIANKLYCSFLVKTTKHPQYELKSKHIEKCVLISDRIEMLKRLPKNGIVAEIGVFRGGFSREILKYTNAKKLYLIDIWVDESVYKSVLESFASEINNGIVEVIRADSRDALRNFEDDYFDYIYIDSYHDYLVPKSELAIANKKVKKEGIICGHDYIKTDYCDLLPYGVVEAVNEFCINENWGFEYMTMENDGFHSYALKRL